MYVFILFVALAAAKSPDVFPPQGLELRTHQTLAGFLSGTQDVDGDTQENMESVPTPQSSAFASSSSFSTANAHGGWYLITGGVGGLGLQTAFALVRHGARRLILTSRGGTIPERYQDDYEKLLALEPELEVRVCACDAGDSESVMALFDSVATSDGIVGVVHSAGVLVDGNIRAQDLGKLRAVWVGKVQGAINLHLASVRQVERGGQPLRLFLLYSSSASLLGSAAASNYGAANAALDNLALLRRQEGLACTSIQWGPWNAVGFAKQAFMDTLEKTGLGSISNSLGALVLNTLLNREGLTQPPVFSVLPIRWSVFAEHGPEFNLKTDTACFEPVKRHAAPKPVHAPMTHDVKVYSELEGPQACHAMVEGVLTEAVLSATGQHVARDDNLADRGITSMEAFELIEIVRRRFPIELNVRTLVFIQCCTCIPCSLPHPVGAVKHCGLSWSAVRYPSCTMADLQSVGVPQCGAAQHLRGGQAGRVHQRQPAHAAQPRPAAGARLGPRTGLRVRAPQRPPSGCRPIPPGPGRAVGPSGAGHGRAADGHRAGGRRRERGDARALLQAARAAPG
jgi:NAD(P)-dependent dehydrogenase (short-subunit alcohol dehydrogenase family)